MFVIPYLFAKEAIYASLDSNEYSLEISNRTFAFDGIKDSL